MFFFQKKEIRPITILLLIFLDTVLLFVNTNLVYYIVLSINIFTLWLQSRKKAIKLATIFLGLYLVVFTINKYFYVYGLLGSIYTMMLIVMKLFPLWVLAVAMTVYDSTEIMNSLRRLHIPKNISIATAIFFRFLPDYIDYFREVKEGLRVRNLKFDIFKMSRSIELYIVPMINKSFKTSEVIASSLITKGIEFDCMKTEYKEMKLGYIDFALIIFSLALMGVSIWIKLYQYK